MSQDKKLFLVRPNLGKPLTLKPSELQNFWITFAGKWPELPGIGEFPSPQNMVKFIADGNLHGWVNGKYVQFHLLKVPSMNLFRSYNPWKPLVDITGNLQLGYLPVSCEGVDKLFDRPDLCRGVLKELKKKVANFPLPNTPDECHYAAGFRWEWQVQVGVDTASTQSLTWPSMINLYFDGQVKYHAIYVTENPPNPENLRFIHFTDTHVSIRNDRIPGILFPSEESNKLEKWNFFSRYRNHNDNLRALIRYANQRAKKRKLDFAIVTGDLADYAYDSYWLKAGDSCQCNFRKFREIITGEDGKGEPLTIPLYTLPGNHEYYRYMTPLLAEIDLEAEEDVPWYVWLIPIANFVALGIALSLTKDKNSAPTWGLSDDEAKKVDSHYGVPRPFSVYDGFKLLLPRFGQFTQYFEEINYDIDYEFTIGPHNFICLNTGQDMGTPQTKDEATEPRTPQQKNFMHGDPDSRGITDWHISYPLRGGLAGGRKFVFTHAPFLNLPKHNEKHARLIFEGQHFNAAALPNMNTAWLGYILNKVRRAPLPGEPEGKLPEFYEMEFGRGYIETQIYENIDWSYSGQLNLNYWSPTLSDVVETLKKLGFPQTGTRFFKQGHLWPGVGHGVAGEHIMIESVLRMLVGGSDRSERRADIVFSGHTHQVHEFRVEPHPNEDKAPWEFLFFIDEYTRSGWLEGNKPLFLTSSSLKKDYPRFREVHVKKNSITKLRMLTLPRPNHPPTYAIEYFFAVASTLLARYGGFSNPARNDKNPCTHCLWAKRTHSRTVIIVDLLEKYKDLFNRFHSKRDKLSQFYTEITLWLNSFGLDFGCPARNSVAPDGHRNWARGVDWKHIFDETANRVEQLFSFTDKSMEDNHNLLGMWFASESVYLAKNHNFDHPSRDSRDPAFHLNWSISVSQQVLIQDIQEKYQMVFEMIKKREVGERPRLIPVAVRSTEEFYSVSSARFAMWGTQCSRDTEPELADTNFFRKKCKGWSEQQIREDIHKRIADLTAKL